MRCPNTHPDVSTHTNTKDADTVTGTETDTDTDIEIDTDTVLGTDTGAMQTHLQIQGQLTHRTHTRPKVELL